MLPCSRAHLGYRYGYCAPLYGSSFRLLAELSVIIDADGEDCWIPRDGWADYRTRSREELIERIHQFGVAGLGGAGFPTGVKFAGWRR